MPVTSSKSGLIKLCGPDVWAVTVLLAGTFGHWTRTGCGRKAEYGSVVVGLQPRPDDGVLAER